MSTWIRGVGKQNGSRYGSECEVTVQTHVHGVVLKIDWHDGQPYSEIELPYTGAGLLCEAISATIGHGREVRTSPAQTPPWIPADEEVDIG